MTMETTFYPDDNRLNSKNTNSVTEKISTLKNNLTLNLPSNEDSTKVKYVTMLQSPDFSVFKLGSPELERIIAQTGGLATTPTPTQFVFPKYVTDEQEAYARGFVDALNKLHHQEAPSKTADGKSSQYSMLSNVSSLKTMTNVPSMAVNVSSSSAQTIVPSNANVDFQPVSRIAYMNQNVCDLAPCPVSVVSQVKEEPQTVPCINSSPPLSPVDMDNQEQIKIERKRARNRLAARKCRTRKLERISQLEDHVSDLKNKNSDLRLTSSQLRKEICSLKQQIMEHIDSGCQVQRIVFQGPLPI